ncbi:MAG: pyridoxamine 5'-phosphate oxidase [Gammaproteobacteria bacterium]|nr:pyridoxamine 5'-phosphate oxidase [Pseudomonadales bacterium]MCP5349153.1 pyridoxamine 5'-phosphate oxidase [Pseudomonadales bacterium]
MDLESVRREYLQGGLQREDLLDEPIEQFNLWMSQALQMELKDPTAMTVATVSGEGQPSQRIVLLKRMEADAFVFFTNYRSRKAREIEVNHHVSLHFPWHDIERQVKVCGVAEKISTADSLRYFLSRPRESQLAAWASAQSEAITSRSFLLNQFESLKQKYAQGEIPLPDFWGGYRVIPHEIEFWQGGKHRLHDRFHYRRQGDGSWEIRRLSP